MKGLLFMFLTALVAVNFTFADEPTQEAPASEGKIIGGASAPAGFFVWHVGITLTNSKGTYFCSGAIISEEWILTAAHCVAGMSKFTIRMGSIYSSGNRNDPNLVTRGAKLAISLQTKPASLNTDVALLRLDRPITFNRFINKIPLARKNEPLQGGENVILSGWGGVDDRGSKPESLRWTHLQTITNQQCKKSFPGLHDNIVCCSGRFNNELSSSCSGDSGGPLVKYDSRLKKWVHVGIASFVRGEGCAKGFPSAYARTSRFIDFINESTGLKFS